MEALFLFKQDTSLEPNKQIHRITEIDLISPKAVELERWEYFILKETRTHIHV